MAISLTAAAVFVGGSAIAGFVAGAFSAYCTGGDVLQGAFEGAAYGAVAATTAVLVSTFAPVAPVASSAAVEFVKSTAISFGFGTAAGAIIETGRQIVSNDGEGLNERKIVKTGITTGISTAVPTLGNPGASMTNSVASLVIGYSALFINAIIDTVSSILFH